MALPDTTRPTLLEARREVSISIRASEEWQPSYKKHPATFKALLLHEAQLEESVAEYLAGLADRAPNYIDWSLIPEPLQVTAASSPLANKDDAVWEGEALDLTKAVIEAITLLVATGGQYGELEYGIDLGITSLSETVLVAAREQTAALVSQVTETNRKLIREAIKQSIARGEDADGTIARIRKVINNPVRAEMIAQTESVNAYGRGLYDFANTTGAKTKTWEALAGACKICAPIDGQTVPIDKPFVLGNGKEVMHPGCHPRGRCGAYYNY
ncbi:phage minor head protein [Rhodococcus rhodochrous]|uniref:phage minor head protein n=1 Tax=Rhodococcus rhodochrous TaxID=1829 RepID=UPI00177E0DED|nr:phage minor head protein [Rhodococcus rhodochrous]QOH56241.1 hypothetical protein C6Y44_09895 [Rhodococcus rhodochrous]